MDEKSSSSDEIPISVRIRELKEEFEKIQQQYYENMKRFYEKRKEIVKSLPMFWWTAFMGHPKLGSMVSEEDQKILTYMESLDVETFPNGINDYTITFNFQPNPFFENTMLSKTFKSKTFKSLHCQVLTPTGTIINWKEGKGPIDVSEYEKVGNKRPLVEDSFFKWFTNEDLVLVGHDEVSELIKNELWPDPTQYLTKEDESSVEGEDFERKCNEEEEDSEDDEDADGSKPDGEYDDDEEEEDDKDDGSKPDREYNDEEKDGADDEEMDSSKPDGEFDDAEEEDDGSKPDREYNDEEEDDADDEEMDSSKPDGEYDDDAEEEDDGSKPDGGYDAEEEDDEDDDGSESNI